MDRLAIQIQALQESYNLIDSYFDYLTETSSLGIYMWFLTLKLGI